MQIKDRDKMWGISVNSLVWHFLFFWKTLLVASTITYSENFLNPTCFNLLSPRKNIWITGTTLIAVTVTNASVLH